MTKPERGKDISDMFHLPELKIPQDFEVDNMFGCCQADFEQLNQIRPYSYF